MGVRPLPSLTGMKPETRTLLVYRVWRFLTFSDLGHDALDRRTPDKDVGILMVILDVVWDRGNEGHHIVERSAAEALLGEFAKPACDQIQPGTRRGSKVHAEGRMPGELRLHPGMRVRSIMVHDPAQVQLVPENFL